MEHNQPQNGFTPHRSHVTVIVDPKECSTFSCDKCREIVAREELPRHKCYAKSKFTFNVAFQVLSEIKYLCTECYRIVTLGCLKDHASSHQEEAKALPVHIQETPKPKQIQSLVKQIGQGKYMISSMLVEDDLPDDLADSKALKLDEEDSFNEDYFDFDDDYQDFEEDGRKIKAPMVKIENEASLRTTYMGLALAPLEPVTSSSTSTERTKAIVRKQQDNRNGTPNRLTTILQRSDTEGTSIQPSKLSGSPILPQKRPRMEGPSLIIMKYKKLQASLARLLLVSCMKALAKKNICFQRMRRFAQFKLNLPL